MGDVTFPALQVQSAFACEESRGVWITRTEISAIGEELRELGFPVLTDWLLDSLADGAYWGGVAVRVCAVAPDVPLWDLFEVVEKTLGVRSTA